MEASCTGSSSIGRSSHSRTSLLVQTLPVQFRDLDLDGAHPPRWKEWTLYHQDDVDIAGLDYTMLAKGNEWADGRSELSGTCVERGAKTEGLGGRGNSLADDILGKFVDSDMRCAIDRGRYLPGLDRVLPAVHVVENTRTWAEVTGVRHGT